MLPLESLLRLALFLWTVPIHGSLAAQKPADRVEFGTVAEIPAGMQGKRLMLADGLDLHTLSPTPVSKELRRRADDPDELVRSIHRMVSQAETGQGLGSGVPNGASRDSTNRLSTGARMGRDMALGVGVVLVGLFTV
ncbi:hypothetical protein MAPG_08772 [Magnaporthiopsis poae ATCC 64411]|uniref:Uncharacterized protein n=1 Tax=Magnaporthiopsis poae (strain ATCC 64411 / 73-15) TaxID=644358 RepID=A0A0C4E878_MAGP6|nr:hypothetical protein MAPG_08772 [Magnaporthiopsis poae ATCC 64411]